MDFFILLFIAGIFLLMVNKVNLLLAKERGMSKETSIPCNVDRLIDGHIEVKGTPHTWAYDVEQGTLTCIKCGVSPNEF